MHRALNVVERRVKAVVNIREVNDPKTLVRGSESPQPNVRDRNLRVRSEKGRRLDGFRAAQRKGRQAPAF